MSVSAGGVGFLEMWNAVRTELNWYQYRSLISIDDPHKRENWRLLAN